ncbi:protein ROOT INITIATION DEFECTIVE 3-like [Dioscorea cayenensis subsp. rotundata]|uniref:Protein ROOT INITIATION DEFECTIVE 3-like n=1 Tax=Dioscorea cayennensis subsp. rotundata TaxID=55577 RepID=A0AB40AM29_DIOCR|nr:protein ROOT INITIATION DEFECTIVE 3-like [Dioscorea cayenensis subsp. rotundata]
MADDELVLATSAVDAGIACWDLRSGSERLRHRPCACAPAGLLAVGCGRFLAASQLPDHPSSTSAPIFFFSWDKPQVEVRSFPAEPICPLLSNSDGTFIFGGGSSGSIYLWEVSSGKLLSKWNAHYRSVTCLTLSDDESMLISGSVDGSVRVWSLLMMFDEIGKEAVRNLYVYSFSEHSLRVTDVVSGHGFCNSIIVSSSEDRTCKIWSLSKGRLLRTVYFPAIINAIAMDPGEHAFYAGGRDGKIYIVALNGEHNPDSSHGLFIIGSLTDHSKAVTCLAFSIDGVTLVSGSEDGTVRVWDAKKKLVVRVLKHMKGPVNNVIIVRQQSCSDSQVLQSRKRMHLSMPPPLNKYINSTDGELESQAVIVPQPTREPLDTGYCSSTVMKNQIKELQNSSRATEMEVEKLRMQCARSAQVAQQWSKLYQDLQDVYVDKMLDDN